ncbi:alanine dehydrogenase [Tessaracoccus sp. MC1756]|uniref:alanine dehydrogenase n=1 Tax=Tessaracoccus sp. MC1756 TaxID=2760311 RepID=UPI0016009F83|nr:alanine dehydrogenase [Tessaracoccus sp. MC1756]MBB1510314.1 alanine dehydrogenase [Tessaracoccus sp. MC1756]
MRISVPREVKNNENRVAITPVGVQELTHRGHEVVVQAGAGVGSSFTDDSYRDAGASVVADVDRVWGDAELVLKVKEPVAAEYRHLREGLSVFTYLHLAADEPLVDALLRSGATSIAYETVQKPTGLLPLLYPMSEVAGCLAPQMGAYHLMKTQGGRGVLMGGVAGVPNAKVLVLGGGTAGQNAVNTALGMNADVTMLDTDIDKLRQAYWRWDNRVHGLRSSDMAIREHLPQADLVIGTVLIPGGRTPRLVTNEMVATMKPGSVLVDVSIDQGGCFEDSRPTTHDDPTYQVHGSTFYCVANMPAMVPNTSTWALTNATLPYVERIAEHGWREAMRLDAALAKGLATHAGRLTSQPVAEAFKRDWAPVEDVLAEA